MNRDTPYMVSVATIQTSKWLLTHAEWHPNEWFGDFGRPETGVRRVSGGKVQEGFELIQHDWSDFTEATGFILMALDKGWDCGRIEDVMQKMLDRCLHRASPRCI